MELPTVLLRSNELLKMLRSIKAGSLPTRRAGGVLGALMNRHNGKLTAKNFLVQQHVCTKCGILRLTASLENSFPIRKYISPDGFKQVGGQTPECIDG